MNNKLKLTSSLTGLIQNIGTADQVSAFTCNLSLFAAKEAQQGDQYAELTSSLFRSWGA